jgi:hypothetical protein
LRLEGASHSRSWHRCRRRTWRTARRTSRSCEGGPELQPIEVDSIPAEPPQGEQGKNKPGRRRGTDDSFTGRAAQLAVTAELLRHRCNAAIPEVDTGTDVFAFKDDREEVVRLQVKACTAPYPYTDGSGYSAKFALPMKQFLRPDDGPPLYYALAVLRDDRWVDFLVVSRAKLHSYYIDDQKFGSLNKMNNDLMITVEFRAQVECSGRDLTDCRNAWKTLPPLQPPPDLAGLDPSVEDDAETAGPADTDLAPPAGPGQT